MILSGDYRIMFNHRRFHVLAVLLLSITALVPSTYARQRAFGYVDRGGEISAAVSSTSRLSSSGTLAVSLPRSYPLATVTVYNTGTIVKPTIYATSAGAPKSNPFTADSHAYWFFYADSGHYDVTFSGGGLAAPYTITDVSLSDGIALAPAPSGGDDSAMLQALIESAESTGLDVQLTSGTYLLYTPLTFAFGTAPVTLHGIPESDTVGTTLKAMGTVGVQRSVIDMLSAYSTISDLKIDANRTAKYGVYMEHAGYTTFLRVWESNALLDGFHVSTVGINQGIQVHSCRATNNGKTYATTGILAQYPNNSVRQSVIAGTAATTSGSNTITITGGPDLTSLGIRTGYHGDMIRVGATTLTSFYGQILSVTATTITLQNAPVAYPTATVSGADFAIGVGYGWYEELAATNGFGVLDNASIFRNNGCGGILENAVYADAITDCLTDYNNFTGISLGLLSNDTRVNSATANKVYMEANVGPDYILGGCADAKIDSPVGGSVLSTGFFSIGGSIPASSGAIIRNGAIESWQSGAPQNFLVEVTNNAGTRQHHIVSEHYSGNGTVGASKINNPSPTYTNTPLVSNVVGFTNGAGILAASPEYLILDTPIAQAGGALISATVEFNNTGTAYYVTVASTSTNVNGTTKTRYALLLTDATGVLAAWSTVTIPAGRTISVRVNGLFR